MSLRSLKSICFWLDVAKPKAMTGDWPEIPQISAHSMVIAGDGWGKGCRIPAASRLTQPAFDIMSHGHDGNRYDGNIYIYTQNVWKYVKMSTF